MAGNLVQINLLGTRFSIQTDQDPTYIQGLLRNLTERTLDIQNGMGLEDPVKVAILAGLFLEDELAKSRNDSSDLKAQEEVEKLRLHMIKSIEETLSN